MVVAAIVPRGDTVATGPGRGRHDIRREVPLLRVLVLALALAQATGLADAVLRSACEECCDEDDCDDRGVPQCPSCQCTSRCPAGVPVTAMVVEPPATGAAPAEFADRSRAPSSPDPREILHVPRLRAG